MKTKEEIEYAATNLANPNVCKTTNWIEGYTQCQEDVFKSSLVNTLRRLYTDKKYTEEDIREAIDMARQLSHVSCLEDGEHRLKYSNTEDEIINSLNKD